MTLTLYKKDSCPYCQRVLSYISSVGRDDIILKDIVNDPEAAVTLVRAGGKKQVPCLFIDGEPMYESMDIINWLQQHPRE